MYRLRVQIPGLFWLDRALINGKGSSYFSSARKGCAGCWLKMRGWDWDMRRLKGGKKLDNPSIWWWAKWTACNKRQKHGINRSSSRIIEHRKNHKAEPSWYYRPPTCHVEDNFKVITTVYSIHKPRYLHRHLDICQFHTKLKNIFRERQRLASISRYLSTIRSFVSHLTPHPIHFLCDLRPNPPDQSPKIPWNTNHSITQMDSTALLS